MQEYFNYAYGYTEEYRNTLNKANSAMIKTYDLSVMSITGGPDTLAHYLKLDFQQKYPDLDFKQEYENCIKHV